MKRFSIVFLLLVFSSIFAFAQTPTGSITGTVSSPDGGVLPGATVVVKFNQTGKTQTVPTGSDGSFSFSQLEPGLYTVTATAAGFKTSVANDLKIDIGREYSLPIVLEVGGVSEMVTVTAGADAITTTSAQVSNVISMEQIRSMPMITRNPLSLTTGSAGTASNPAQGTAINGMRTSLTNITRDGISINDAFIRANATDFAPGRPSVDDTAEYTLVTANQEADLGSGGAQIILVTPRGTSDFHGALFAYNRNSKFSANNFFNNKTGVARPFRNRNQYGGKVSGPFWTPNFGEGGPMFETGKGYFFIAYEGVRDPVSARSGIRTILTPSARTGEFKFTRASAGNPTAICPSGAVGSACSVPNILAFAQAQGFAGIPSSTSPASQALILNAMPAAGNTTFGDSLNTTGFALNRGQDQTISIYTTRFDLDASDEDAINVVYSWNKENNLRPDVDATGFTPIPDVSQYSKNKTFTIAHRRIFSSSIVNEVRWGLFTSEVPFDRTSEPPAFFLGLGTGLETTSGSIAHGIISNPTNIFLDQGRNNKSFTFADNLNWVVGKHSLKFGGQFQRTKVDSYNDVGIIPKYAIGTTSVDAATNTTFSTTANFANSCTPSPCASTAQSLISDTQLNTANGLLAIHAGLVNGAVQGFNTSTPTSGYAAVRNLAPYRNNNHALYASDRWSVTPSLTVTLGLRYELYPALTLANGLSLEPVISDPKNPAASLLAGNGTLNIIGTNAGSEFAYYKTDKDNFAPSFGAAWSPRFESGVGKLLFGTAGRTVIRGGYAHIYGNDSIITSLAGTLNANLGLGRGTGFAIGPAANTNLNARLSDLALPGVSPPAFVAPPRSFLQNNTVGQGFFGTANVVDPLLKIPKTEQYSVGYQREFFGNTAFEIRYVGTRSNNLARGIDLNEIEVVNNGFLADFNRALANRRLTGNAFCTTAGCQTLTLLRNVATGPQPLRVGTGVTLTTFNSLLDTGQVADLAHAFVATNLNNHPTLLSPTNVPFVRFYQNPNIGQIELFTNAGSYNYNSLQAEVRRRFTDGLFFAANYTFSKNLTDTVGTSQGLFEPRLQNARPELEKQRADFDQTHVINFSALYNFPFGKGKKFLNYGGALDLIFGGWELAGGGQWSTGAPISFIDGTGTTTRGTINRGVRSTRQTVNSSLTNAQVQGLTGIFQQTVAGVDRIYYLNPAVINTTGRGTEGFGTTAFNGQVFFNPGPGTTGTLGRTLINGPRYFNASLGLLKSFRFTETTRIQVRAEAFNVFNVVSFTTGGTQLAHVGSSTFGQITAANAARVMQFAARFEF